MIKFIIASVVLAFNVVASAEDQVATGTLSEVISAIESGKTKPKKYIARPVLSSKDTLLLKGKTKAIKVVPTMQAGFASTSTIVDLRSLDTAVRNQGQEGLCTAFATVAAIEFGAKYALKLPNEDLSERHLWSMYRQYYTTLAVKAAKNYITTETIWPYANSKAVGVITQRGALTIYKTATTMAEVYKALDDRKAVILSADTNPSWSNPNKGILLPTGKVQGGHAIKVSGYFDTSKGRYMIIKNSWGSSYGDKGYVYLPESYCSKYYCSFIIVDGSKFR